MKDAVHSCDTNVLYYYLNAACPEHSAASKYLKEHLDDENFAICELVLTELYVLLRHTKLNRKPASAAAAWRIIDAFRNNPRWAVIDYPGNLMDEVWREASGVRFRAAQIFDSRLAFTLKHHGVSIFATRNTKDFSHYDFLEVINPIDT